MLLDFHVTTVARFSLRNRGLFEMSRVEITRVDCILHKIQDMFVNLDRSEYYDCTFMAE